VLTLDLEHNILVASIGISGNFTASNVKTRRDVAEVLAMIYTYQDN
jgi:hypothetical protein